MLTTLKNMKKLQRKIKRKKLGECLALNKHITSDSSMVKTLAQGLWPNFSR